jgi:hypothetical protein
MNESVTKKSNDELLKELHAEHERRHRSACELLDNIKRNVQRIDALSKQFRNEEPDLVYRFYHQSFKVFIMNSLIESADDLFKELGPGSKELNSWYRLITKTALAQEFDASETNEKWLHQTPPILLAFWNAKYFLEQMIVAADALETAPQVLPSGWAAVLYLYNLR